MELNRQEISEFIIVLMENYQDELLRVINTKINNKADAEDVVNELWIEAVREVNFLYAHANQRAWLFYKLDLVIKRYRSKGTIRTQKTDSKGNTVITKQFITEHPVSEFIDPVSSYTEEFYEGELFDKYKTILTEREMQYLIYAYKYDYSTDKIADLMGMSYSATTTMGTRVRKKIKKFIENE